MTIEGGCCCGEIRYRIVGELVDARRCHCSRCRKIFGGTGSAYAEVRPGEFRWLKGEAQLTRFGDNDGWAHCIAGTGRFEWKEQVGAPVRSIGAIVAPDRVVFGLDNDLLVGLKCQ